MKTMIFLPTHQRRRKADDGLAILMSIFLSMGMMLPLYAGLLTQG